MFEAIHFLHCGCLEVAGSYGSFAAWAIVIATVAIAAVGALVIGPKTASVPA